MTRQPRAPRRRAVWLVLPAVLTVTLFSVLVPLQAVSYGTPLPLAMLAATVMGLVVSDAEARNRVVDFVLDNLPLEESRARHDLEVLLLNVTRNVAGFGLLGLLTLLLAASGVMGSIRHALNAAFGWAWADPAAALFVAVAAANEGRENLREAALIPTEQGEIGVAP